MRCSKCGADNREIAKFCDSCGGSFQQSPLQDTVLLSEVSSSGRADSAAPYMIDGERKTVTVLCADLKGSTELMRNLDPEEARGIVDPLLQLMIAAVHRYGGYVAQSTGDGIFAMFGAPVADEDHPQRALHAALAIQEELRLHDQSLKATQKEPVEARIGLNTGEVVLRMVNVGGRTEYSPVGHAANLAARLQTVAPVGGVIVSDETRTLVEGYFELRDLGAVTLKGIPEPVQVFEVLGTGPVRGHFDAAARRGLTKFVGREQEVAQIQRAFELASRGHGQFVAIMASAGAGKSRLVYEFKRRLAPGCKLLEAYSVSHGKASPWLPVMDLLRNYFGIDSTDEPAAKREKVRRALQPAFTDTLPYLFGLFGIIDTPDPLAQIDPNIKRQRTLHAIKRIVLSESQKQPVVVIFEDLHWIDSQTQALLDLLADSLSGASVLLLVNYRPEYQHEWGNESNYWQIRLEPLAHADAAEMLTTLLGADTELEQLKRLIAQRTGGNPFFIEEIVQALFDQGALVRNGVVKATRSLSQFRLPTTVQGILTSRIDRLPTAQKNLLQTLAVIGSQAHLRVVSCITSSDQAELGRMLAELQAGEFIYEKSVATGFEYVFTHALVEEVAYNSLLIERRKQLHERIGDALESLFAPKLHDHVHELAHHYSRSNNIRKAVDYLGFAGRHAIRRWANAEGLANLTTAIGLLQSLPDGPERAQRELRMQLAAIPAFIALKGWGAPEIERSVTRAGELCERLGNPAELFVAVYGFLWMVRWIGSDMRAALAVARQLLERAESSHNSAHLLVAHHMMGEALSCMGELHLARRHHEAALELDDPQKRLAPTGIDEKVLNLMCMAKVGLLLGYPDEALKRANEALTIAENLSDPRSVASAEWSLGILFLFRGDPEAARRSTEREIAISNQYGIVDMLPYAGATRGAALSRLGSSEEALELIRKGLADERTGGVRVALPDLLCFMGNACLRAQTVDDGLKAVNEAIAIADEWEHRALEPEAYRLKGELILAGDSSRSSQALKCFETAIEIARNQSAKFWELRATMSRARLLAKQGRRDQARTMLAAIYNWFTEGFDTADLKEAKALLDELSD